MEPSAEEVRRMLQQVDVEGWDGPTGRHLLHLARRAVVGPAVRRCGLRGAAAAQAEASAWAAAWDALRRPSARTAEAPLALARVAAQRAAWAEVRAGRPDAGLVVIPLEVALGVDPQLVAPAPDPGGDGAAGGDGATGREGAVGSGPILGVIRTALIRSGWPRDDLDEAIALLADRVQPGRGGQPRVPWRWVALRLGLPEWQVRRLAVLLLGRGGVPGLIVPVAHRGAAVLEDPAAIDALVCTVRRWMPGPETFLAELADGSGDGRMAS
jgi:hypothetical protein